MIPLNPALIKAILIALGGMAVMTPMVNIRNNKYEQPPKIIKKQDKPVTQIPIPKEQSKKPTPKIPNTPPIVNTIIEYKNGKLPITGGYKPGKNPLPAGRTSTQNYQEAWTLLKKELGLK